MLIVPHHPTATWRVDNFQAPAGSTLGVSVTPGASNVKGAWTQMFSAATVANDVHGFYLYVGSASTSAASKPMIFDIGIDPAGGTSYTAIITDFIVGGPSGTTSQGIRQHFFPMFIKAGSSVAVRSQTANATAGTMRVAMRLYGNLSQPEAFRVGTFSEKIGAVASSLGVSFTPGSTGVWGTRVSLGSTVNDLWWWQLGYQIDNATVNAEVTDIELSVGDGTTFQVISTHRLITTTSEVANGTHHPHLHPLESYMPLAAGSTLYVRGMCSAAPTTGYNCNVIGVGG